MPNYYDTYTAYRPIWTPNTHTVTSTTDCSGYSWAYSFNDENIQQYKDWLIGKIVNPEITEDDIMNLLEGEE